MTEKDLRQNWRDNPPRKVVCSIHGEHRLTLTDLLAAKRRGQLAGTWGERFVAYGVCCSRQQASTLYW